MAELYLCRIQALLGGEKTIVHEVNMGLFGPE